MPLPPAPRHIPQAASLSFSLSLFLSIINIFTQRLKAWDRLCSSETSFPSRLDPSPHLDPALACLLPTPAPSRSLSLPCRRSISDPGQLRSCAPIGVRRGGGGVGRVGGGGGGRVRRHAPADAGPDLGEILRFRSPSERGSLTDRHATSPRGSLFFDIDARDGSRRPGRGRRVGGPLMGHLAVGSWQLPDRGL
jgi:hypothetical protein